MDFSSDTSAPAHPAVIEAIVAANSGNASSYGHDDVTSRVVGLLHDVFETQDMDVHICASGTAANALALSVLCSSTGAILCHEEAHIERDERGAPEFFTGGGKLQLLPGHAAKIDPDALQTALNHIDRSFVHETPPETLSLTNLTECGAAYTNDEIRHFAGMAAAKGLNVHLDGARLANALVSTGASPADMTWRAGVDVVTFGLTKTGAMGCEIIILFGEMRRARARLLAQAKRSGHMPPKARYLAAQAEGVLTDGLWMRLAAAANGSATKLAAVITESSGADLVYPVDGNEVFTKLPDQTAAHLKSQGCRFYPWPGGSYRFVCNWKTSDADIEALRQCLQTA